MGLVRDMRYVAGRSAHDTIQHMHPTLVERFRWEEIMYIVLQS